MIATCPSCQTRYKVAPEKIGPGGARIRCQKCSEVFRVEPQAPEPEAEVEPQKFVARAVVAVPDLELAKAIRAYLEAHAIESMVMDDGGKALLHMHRERPDLAVLGAKLPGVSAPAIAEILRRNADLQEVPLVREFAADESASAPEFDADHTLESADLPEGLGAILDEFGIGQKPKAAAKRERPAPERSAPQPPKPEPSRPEVPKAAPKAPAAKAPSAPASDDPELKAAERLARIVVSDIILYNEEKFAAAAQAGNPAEALAAELEEAAAMFRERVSEELRSQRDFLVEELERRAAKRCEN